MKKVLLLMLTFLTLGISGFAQNTLTVANGTTTNSYVPVYGFYADAYLRCQTIYTAGALDAAAAGYGMNGGTITGLTYYLSSPASEAWTGTWEVKLMEVTASTLSAFVDMTNATTVYTGTLDGSSSTLTINFTTPYTYQGGNLLIEVNETTIGNYKSASFYGVSSTGASWQGYDYDFWSDITGSVQNFVPKTTFTFTGGTAITCSPVQNLSIDANQTTSSSLTLTWTDAANTGATYTVYNMADNSVVQSGINDTTYTVTGLNANTNYTFGVEANCSATDVAAIMTVSGTTSCGSETMPWSENFDNWTSKSPCWSFLSGLLSEGNPTANASAWTLNTSYGSYITISGKALTMNLYSSNRYWAVTPPIEITSNSAILGVDVAVSAWSSATPNYDDNDTLAFLISTDNGTTYTLLQAINHTQLNALGNTYTTLFIPVSGYNGQTVRFAIYGGSVSGTSPYDNRIAIDNVTVGDASCLPVTNLTASEVNSYGATLNWVGQANSYNIYNMADSSLVLTTSDTNVVINTLNPNTPYTLGVQADCGSAQGAMVTVSFTTLVTCPAPTNLAVTLTPGDGTVASLSWTETGTAQAWQICLNGDTNNLIDVTTNPYDLSGLTPDTAYTAQVRANCDVNDQSAWSNLVTFTPTNAYVITVNDGTSTNGYVPIYGYWCDNITKSQFIIPASSLSAMQFGIINKLTFHASNANVSWGSAEFNVYVTETNETTVSALADYSTMTQVYAGTLSISNNIMEVTLTNPYLYMGGNLMIGFLQTVSGTFSSCSWYGVSATGASQGGYGTSISQQNFLPKTTIAYTPGTQPSCLPVTNLTASNVTESSATISWSGTGDSYTIIDMSDTSVVTTITDTTYDFTNLAPTTQYMFGVVSNCGADQSIMVTVSFTTACGAVAIPFTEGFETNSPTLGCWSVANIAANTGITTSNPYSGNNAFVFAYNTNPPQYLISPELSGTGNGLSVSFMYRINSTSYPESFQLGYSTTTNDISAFTWGVEQTNLLNTTYDEYSEILPADVKYVCIKYTANDQYYLFIDDVAFMTPPSCLPATALTVDTVTDNSVTISWTGTAPSYDVYNGTTFVANVTTTTYTFTGLSAASNYTFGVQAICSATDSANMVTVSASTECGVITVYPYTQDFSVAPACWMILDADGDGYNWSLYQGTIQSASYSSAALTPDNWLITPQFAIPATGSYEVTWTATAQDQSWPAEHYGVFVSTTVNNDTAAYTMLQEWTLGPGIFNPVIDLSAYAGQNIYIALRHFNCTDQFRLSIDEFIVREQAGANQVTINVGQNNAAYGTVTGAGIYNIGDNVTVSATANSGYTFSKWVDDNNTLLSNANPYTFVAATDLNLTAIFLNDAGTTYTITVNVNDSTMGTATGAGTYTAGDQITLTATPFSGYNFVNWTQVSGFGTNVVGTDSILIITVTSDKTFVANFEAGSGNPTVATNAATAIGETTATLNATITNPDGVTITAKGFEWKATTGGTYTQVAGTGTGNTFTADLTGLTANTSYTFKAFITYNGTTVYGSEMTFTTQSSSVTPPTVTTNAATNITQTTATLNGAVTAGDETITAQGFEWKETAGGTYTVVNATGTTMSYDLTGLTPNTSYTFRAFATTASGTTYGDEKTFTTEPVGIENHEMNNVVVYPNPTKGTVKIQNSEFRIQNVEVYDAYGKLLNVVNVNDNAAAIDMSDYAEGIYFLKVKTDNGTVTKRIIRM